MALAFNQRNLILGGALLLTLWATYWVSQQENKDEASDLAVSTHRGTRPDAQQAALADQAKSAESPAGVADSASWASYQRSLNPIKSSDLFKPHSWYVPPPPPKVKPVVVAPPPPKPVAPPAPFAYMGKLENVPGGTQYFLSSNNRVYTVQKGQSIDASWRLDGEDENALRLTHLPTGLVQTFSKLNNPAAIK
jgi:hypothetical protein